MDPLRILYVTPYLPSPIRVRSYSLIKYLSDRGHLLTVLSAQDTGEAMPAMAALRAHCERLELSPITRRESLANCVRALPSSMPLQAVYSWTPGMQDQIVGELRGNGSGHTPYDLIHVEHIRGAKYALGLDANIPIVWDSVDCISYLFEQASQHSRTLFGRLMTRFELSRTRRYEARLLDWFDRILVTSPLDKSALERLVAGGKGESNGHRPAEISVLTNGVDLDYFRPSPLQRESEVLIFTGKMSYHANATSVMYLAQEIMPHIWAQRPTVELWIVGKDPPSSVRRLGEDSRVVVTGYVDDLRPYIARATVSVNPICYGAGIQNKVLEAMAMGTPVVATARACSAIEIEEGRHILVADSPAAFAEKVVRLLDDPDMRRRIGAAGRSYVEQHHDWRNVVAELEDLYRETVRYGRRSDQE